jgi:galactose mutarotase-like enzyme
MRSTRVSSVLAVIAGLVLLSTSTRAHHGAASLYDVNKEVTMKATITEFVWTSPHVEVGVASVDDKSQRLLLELGSPPNIVNRGWTAKSLKPGDVVTVTYNPGLRGMRIGRLLKVVLPDGKELRA